MELLQHYASDSDSDQNDSRNLASSSLVGSTTSSVAVEIVSTSTSISSHESEASKRSSSSNYKGKVKKAKKQRAPSSKLSPYSKADSSLPSAASLLGIDSVTVSTSTAAPLALSTRVRNFNHIPGQWATHVHIRIPSTTELSQLINEAKQVFERYLISSCVSSSSSLSPPLFIWNSLPSTSLHLSLSRTVILSYSQINSFIALLRQSVKESRVNAFEMRLKDLRVYVNEERNTSFQGLIGREGQKEDDSSPSLLRLIGCVDSVLQTFDLPPFYSNPSFHVTYSSTLGDVIKHLHSIKPSKEESEKSSSSSFSSLFVTDRSCIVQVREIECDIGNKRFVIDLSGIEAD